MMSCYSMFSGSGECEACEYKGYCRDAKDPRLLVDDARYLDFQDALLYPLAQAETTAESERKKRRYSEEDILTVIRFMTGLSFKEMRFLAALLDNPNMWGNCAEAARKLGVTRQAMHKFWCAACMRHPELTHVFNFRRRRCKK